MILCDLVQFVSMLVTFVHLFLVFANRVDMVEGGERRYVYRERLLLNMFRVRRRAVDDNFETDYSLICR